MKLSEQTLTELLAAFKTYRDENPEVTSFQIFVEETYISTLIETCSYVQGRGENVVFTELGPEWRVEDGRCTLITVPK